MLRLGFTSRAPIYDSDDCDLTGKAKPDAKPVAHLLYREPTVDEQMRFNKAYFAAVSKKDDEIGGSAGQVLYDFGALLLEGADGIAAPEGVDPVEAVKRWGHHHIITLAQRVYVRGRGQLDLGKSDASGEPSSEASSAPSRKRTAGS